MHVLKISHFDHLEWLKLVNYNLHTFKQYFKFIEEEFNSEYICARAGVATAFASKDILGNVLSGLSVQMSQPFSVGDTIRVC